MLFMYNGRGLNSRKKDEGLRMSRIYTNPVTDLPSADPFVLRHAGAYWAYVTGAWHDGRYFGILHSPDLVNWQPLSGALAPLEPPPGMDYTCYWAPEVTYENGLFYLYYSVGDEEHMHIRVATSEEPEGPFTDRGYRLTNEQFAIDGHVFIDDDGRRYFFYATDFLDHTHIGTGIVVDRMLDPFTLAGDPRPAARARYDWQVYDPARVEKGGVRWHTVEGPFVLKRKGRHAMMFSGGNWQNDTYGLAYALSTQVDASQEWQQPVDGIQTPPVLQSDHARGVVGPGHNSVVRGPDGRQLYCVYHRWNAGVGARVMAVDRLEWIGERLAVLGPSTEEQTIASPPQRQRESFHGAQQFPLPEHPFLLEASLLPSSGSERFEIKLKSKDAALLALVIDRREGRMAAATPFGQKTYPLPDDYRLDRIFYLRLEVNSRLVSLSMDGHRYHWSGPVATVPTELALHSRGEMQCTLSLTPGWEDSFEYELSPAELGWRAEAGAWEVEQGQLQQTEVSLEARASKALPAEINSYEMVVNARLLDDAERPGAYVIFPAAGNARWDPAFAIRPNGSGWELSTTTADGTQAATLPHWFDPYQYQQFRFVVNAKEVRAFLEDVELSAAEITAVPRQVGLGTLQATAAFELVRLSPL
jgi:GH43 family beta-xylosidase